SGRQTRRHAELVARDIERAFTRIALGPQAHHEDRTPLFAAIELIADARLDIADARAFQINGARHSLVSLLHRGDRVAALQVGNARVHLEPVRDAVAPGDRGAQGVAIRLTGLDHADLQPRHDLDAPEHQSIGGRARILG